MRPLSEKERFLMPFWNIELLSDCEIDQQVFDIISRYNAYTAVMREDAYDERVRRISDEIAASGFFSHPEVVQVRWEQCFTAEQYFGYFMTGNVFIRNSDETKAACYKELEALEKRYGTIPRHFVSALYVSQKI